MFCSVGRRRRTKKLLAVSVGAFSAIAKCHSYPPPAMASGSAEVKVEDAEEKHEGVVLRVDSSSKEGPIMRIRNVHKTYLLGIGAMRSPPASAGAPWRPRGSTDPRIHRCAQRRGCPGAAWCLAVHTPRRIRRDRAFAAHRVACAPPGAPWEEDASHVPPLRAALPLVRPQLGKSGCGKTSLLNVIGAVAATASARRFRSTSPMALG